MRGRELHPLCCISIDLPSSPSSLPPDPASDLDPNPSGPDNNADDASSDILVAGVLQKWTNFSKGWRSRWFTLRSNGVLSYSKIQSSSSSLNHRHYLVDNDGNHVDNDDYDVRVIGSSASFYRKKRKQQLGFVHLKISSFRESNSDDKKFYIFSPTKTLHLRTNSKDDRMAWIEALVSARSKISMNDKSAIVHNDISFSTKKLRDRMLSDNIDESIVKDCEQIMQSEFSEFHRQLKLQHEEHLHMVNTFRQQLETVNQEQDSMQLMNHEFLGSGHGKFSGYSTTESSDDVEKQELDDSSDEETSFFDTKEAFSESSVADPSSLLDTNYSDSHNINDNFSNSGILQDGTNYPENMTSNIKRRKKLPEPVEKEKGVSLWSIIKDNVGKDLTRVCLPVYFNEPLSSLQKCFEDLEYSYLLDQAYEHGKKGNSIMRILNVAAFAVSGYASSDGRPCKPFNPLLGETYEADFPEKGIRFFSEKVSHHPMLIACHSEGRGWKFWGDSNLRSKFWGRSIQLDPLGVLTLEFDDGEIFQWSKVTTSIYNLIFGKVYCDHHGTMSIQGNRQYSCKLKFKEQSLLDRNPRQVQGSVEDAMGKKVATLTGKWDDSMYYHMTGDDASNKNKGSVSNENANLLWKRSKPAEYPTRYNLSSFAITLNELTPELEGNLPPTDSRLRPDQRHLENGAYEKAFAEKLRLEARQRMSSKLQENGWKPRWFEKDNETGTYRYVGGYWEAREENKWEECPDIFGEFTVDTNGTSCN